MKDSKNLNVFSVVLVILVAVVLVAGGYYYGRTTIEEEQGQNQIAIDEEVTDSTDEQETQKESIVNEGQTNDKTRQAGDEETFDVDEGFLIDLRAFMDARIERNADEANMYVSSGGGDNIYTLTQLTGLSSPTFSDYEILSAEQSTISSTDGPFSIYFVEVRIDESVGGEKTSYFKETQIWNDTIGIVSHLVDKVYFSNRIDY
jgi:hypothetical protein